MSTATPDHLPPSDIADCLECGQPYDRNTRLPAEPDDNGEYVASSYCSDKCEFDGLGFGPLEDEM